MSTFSTFAGYQLVSSGDLKRVLEDTKALLDSNSSTEPILIFDHSTGRQVDFDFRGSVEDVLARVGAKDAVEGQTSNKAGKGRPRLGVVPAEVTLLPRHWEWLSAQPAKASGTLRRLVEEARAREGSDPRLRIQALGNLLWSLGGNLPGFEEATRALYAQDRNKFFALSDSWPGDLPAFVRAWLDPEGPRSVPVGAIGAGSASPAPEDQALLEDLYKDTPRQGPGGEAQTEQALQLVRAAGAALGPGSRILDLGCGTGAQTLVLASNTGSEVVAVDLLQGFLDRLGDRVREAGFGGRVKTLRASMDALPFEEGGFDLIWAEGSAYNVGFREGLTAWRRLLKRGGFLGVTELCWFGAGPRPVEVETYWKSEYPAIDTVGAKLRVAEDCGYVPAGFFTLPRTCWIENYYGPLEQGLEPFLARQGHSAEALRVVEGVRSELDLYGRFGAFYGYAFFILQKRE